MDRPERIKMVKAMEFIARAVNSENVFAYWLAYGVPDGDVEPGDLTDTEPDRYWSLDDKTMVELMDTFLALMTDAREDGGLYCDGVVSNEWIDE